MRKILFSTLILLAAFFTSCEYDNYEEPESVLEGTLTYKGQPYLYDGNPERGLLKLLQTGYGKVDAGIGVYVSETGQFKQLLYDEQYGITLNNSQYPFEMPDFKSNGVGLGYDTVQFHVNKNVKLNFEVIPYYEIQDLKVTIEGANFVARFKTVKTTGTIKEAPAIAKVRFYVGPSSKVNGKTFLSAVKNVKPNDAGEFELTIKTKDYRSKYINNFRNYAFCRVSVELDGVVDYYLFSDILKLTDVPL